MGFHAHREVMDPGNNQKLPGFATFLSLTMPDEVRQTVPMAVPSPPLSGTFMSANNHYAGMPPASSAGDKFRNWFPDADIEPELRTPWTDPWASRKPASTATLDPDNTNLRMALLGHQRVQNTPPRRTSLPSISSFTSRKGLDMDGEHPLRRASESNTPTGERSPTLLNTLDIPVPQDVRGLGKRSIRMPGAARSHVLPERPATFNQQPTTPPASGMPKSSLSNLIHPSPTPPNNAPSTPPPSPVSPRTQTRCNAESGSEKAPSVYTQMESQKRKCADMNAAEDGGESGGESERKRYKCPFDGCGRLYTWKENLTRHITTRHSPIPTPRRCPFCKVNAARLSFNRIDNFKEHILRHSRDRDNCRARTEFHPAAEEYYRRLSDAAKGERKQAKGRGRGMMSPRSEASDDSVEAEEQY